MGTRRNFTAKVQVQIIKRATREGIVYCEGCGLPLKKWEIDHTIADALVVEKKALTAEDGQLLGDCCHRGPDGKTNKDIKAIAKAKRNEANHLGVKRRKKPIQSRGFETAKKRPKIDKSALPPLQRPPLYKPMEGTGE